LGKIKKVLFLVMSMFGVMTLYMLSAAASADVKPDELVIAVSDIKVKSIKLKAGDKLNLSMKVTGNGYVAIQTVTAQYVSCREQSLKIPLKYNAKTGLWTASFKIPKGMQSGLWKLAYVSANIGLNEDGDWEASFRYSDDVEKELQKGDVRISGTKPDYTRPKINFKSLSATRKVNKSKGIVKLTYRVKVKDKSPIEFVNIVLIEKGNDYDDGEVLRMKYNKKTGYYEGSVWKPHGTYQISSISAEDVFGNQVYYYNKYYYGKGGQFYSGSMNRTRNFSKYDLSSGK